MREAVTATTIQVPRRVLFTLLGLTLAVVLCGTGALALLNATAVSGSTPSQTTLLERGMGFLALLGLAALARRNLFLRITRLSNDVIARQRSRLASKLVAIELAVAEALPRGLLADSLTRDAQTLTQSAHQIAEAAQSLVLGLAVLLYLFWLSPAAACLVVLLAGLTFGLLTLRMEAHTRLTTQAAATEATLLATALDLQSAAKEIRLSAHRREAMLDAFRDATCSVAAARMAAARPLADVSILGNIIYFVAGAIVFLLPVVAPNIGDGRLHLLAVTFFLLGPIFVVIAAFPALARARAALAHIRDLEARLDGNIAEIALFTPAVTPARETFRGLRADGLCHTYRSQGGEAAFRVGPLDFALESGEIVFLTGGNGSGKTTALRLLTGLYAAEAGVLWHNGRAVARAELAAYREIFATVFADFHVPRRPYGLAADRLPLLRKHLDDLGIVGKLPTDLTQGFDPDQLSSGERRRLALALAVAEGRPVLVLDEWAADQDPDRRRWFYTELLPDLRHAGTAVLAVSHDERHFKVADRRIHFEGGRVVLPNPRAFCDGTPPEQDWFRALPSSPRALDCSRPTSG